MPIVMLKTLYNLNDRNKNNKLVNIIKSGLSDFKNEIENTSEKKRKKKKKKKLENHMK